MKATFKTLLLLMLSGTMLIAQNRQLPADTTVVTNHETIINGKKVLYKATTGTQPVWNEDGKVIAALYYTYYKRTDIRDDASRPLVMSFNGGPGSASVWMHVAYTGPKVLNIDPEGYPLQPYGVKSNPNSILDVADIVYINPVNTGYSRILDEEAKNKPFLG